MTSYVVCGCLLYIIFIFALNLSNEDVFFEFILWRSYTYGGTDLQNILCIPAAYLWRLEKLKVNLFMNFLFDAVML